MCLFSFGQTGDDGRGKWQRVSWLTVRRSAHSPLRNLNILSKNKSAADVVVRLEGSNNYLLLLLLCQTELPSHDHQQPPPRRPQHQQMNALYRPDDKRSSLYDRLRGRTHANRKTNNTVYDIITWTPDHVGEPCLFSQINDWRLVHNRYSAPTKRQYLEFWCNIIGNWHQDTNWIIWTYFLINPSV